MERFNELINICEEFINGKFDIEKFQNKIETIVLPDKCKKTLEKEQHNACNKLEEIKYCYADSQKEYANKVAVALIRATIEEQKHFKK